jgi:hypothetical protein
MGLIMLKIKIMPIILAVLLALGLLVVVVSAETATPTAANVNEAAPTHFSDLITSAKANNKPISFDFVVPLVSGERVWTVPDDTAKRSISAVGADYVCFSEPWNGGSRERCTTFSNISSITFSK